MEKKLILEPAFPFTAPSTLSVPKVNAIEVIYPLLKATKERFKTANIEVLVTFV